GLSAALVTLRWAYSVADHKLRPASYRHVVLIFAGFLVAVIVGISVVAIAGTPDWTVVVAMTLTLSLISFLAVQGAIQVRGERDNEREET
nr:hypothetical protein [Actinomycetota bacterium]